MPEVAVAGSSFQRRVRQDFAWGGATKPSRRREGELSDPIRGPHRASLKISTGTWRIPGDCPAPIAMALRAFTSSAAIRWKRGFWCARISCNLMYTCGFDCIDYMRKPIMQDAATRTHPSRSGPQPNPIICLWSMRCRASVSGSKIHGYLKSWSFSIWWAAISQLR